MAMATLCSGYWSGEPVMDTTGNFTWLLGADFSGSFRFSLGTLCRGTLTHGPLICFI